MDDLLFAVLCLIELGSLVYVFHSVAQHAVDEPGEFGGHGPGRHRRPQPSPNSAELRRASAWTQVLPRRGTCDRGIWMKPLAFAADAGRSYL